MIRRVRGQGGSVAGAEALAVGTLVALACMVMVANAWAVIDARMALESAAREYLRTYTEASDATQAAAGGEAAARAVLADRRSVAGTLSIEAPDPSRFGPCQPAPVVLTADVEAIRLPLVGGFGGHTVVVRAVELIDAHREMAPGADHDASETACAN